MKGHPLGPLAMRTTGVVGGTGGGGDRAAGGRRGRGAGWWRGAGCGLGAGMPDNERMSETDAVPVVELPGDARMPMVGFGTWKVTGDQVAGAVAAALATG